MKRRVTVKTYKRKTKSGKVVVVRQHTAAKESTKALAKKGIKGTATSEVPKEVLSEWWKSGEKGDEVDTKLKEIVGATTYKAMWKVYNDGDSMVQLRKVMKSGTKSSPKTKATTKTADTTKVATKKSSPKSSSDKNYDEAVKNRDFILKMSKASVRATLSYQEDRIAGIRNKAKREAEYKAWGETAKKHKYDFGP